MLLARLFRVYLISILGLSAGISIGSRQSSVVNVCLGGKWPVRCRPQPPVSDRLVRLSTLQHSWIKLVARPPGAARLGGQQDSGCGD